MARNTRLLGSALLLVMLASCSLGRLESSGHVTFLVAISAEDEWITGVNVLLVGPGGMEHLGVTNTSGSLSVAKNRIVRRRASAILFCRDGFFAEHLWWTQTSSATMSAI